VLEHHHANMHHIRFSFNTLILGYKIIKFISYMFQQQAPSSGRSDVCQHKKLKSKIDQN
jgi:hypothetical protein